MENNTLPSVVVIPTRLVICQTHGVFFGAWLHCRKIIDALRPITTLNAHKYVEYGLTPTHLIVVMARPQQKMAISTIAAYIPDTSRWAGTAPVTPIMWQSTTRFRRECPHSGRIYIPKRTYVQLTTQPENPIDPPLMRDFRALLHCLPPDWAILEVPLYPNRPSTFRSQS